MSSSVADGVVASGLPGGVLSTGMRDVVVFDLVDCQDASATTLASLVGDVNLILARLAAVDFYVDECRGGVAVRYGDAQRSVRSIPSEVLPELSKKVQELGRCLL